MAKKIYLETGGWFLEAYSVMTNSIAKWTNSIAKVTNSFANGMNSIAKTCNCLRSNLKATLTGLHVHAMTFMIVINYS